MPNTYLINGAVASMNKHKEYVLFELIGSENQLYDMDSSEYVMWSLNLTPNVKAQSSIASTMRFGVLQ